MKFIPREYQRIAGRFLLTHPRCALWLSCGLGKTSTTLIALQWLIDTKRIKRAVVFAPLRVANTWPVECSKWDDLHIKVAACVGTPKQRLEALKKNTEIVSINFEQAEWLLSQKVEFDAVVIDEASRIKSFRPTGGGKYAKAIGILCKKATCVFELTGTPAANHLDDLYGQIAILDHGQRLGRSMTAFHNKYFSPIRVGRDPFAVRWEPLPTAQRDIQDAISDIVCSIRTEEFFPVDQPIFNRIDVSLPQKASKIYANMEKELFSEIAQGVSVEAVNAGSKLTKCLQIASGFLYTEQEQSVALHDEKIEALRSIIEESGEPIVVCYWFKADCERLLKAFPEAKCLDRNPETLTQWNAGKIPILLIHPASAGHGLNLQDGGRTMVFFGHAWSLELREQAIERLGPTRQKQSGHERPVYIYDIVCKGTVEELILKRYVTKKSVQDTLLEALETYRKQRS